MRASSLAHLARVQLAEALQRSRCRAAVGADDDLAAIRRVVAPRPAGPARRAGRPGRWRSSGVTPRRAASSDMRMRAGRQDEVQHLGLRHGHLDVVELRGVRRPSGGASCASKTATTRSTVARRGPAIVSASLVSSDMFGISVLFGSCRRLYRMTRAVIVDLAYHRPVTRHPDRRPRDRAPLPRRAATCSRRRAPCPPEPASVRTRRRPARLAPVRPARGRGPQPRPRPRGADRRLPARVDRRPAVRRALRCSRPTTRACRIAADRRAAVVPGRAGTASARPRTRRHLRRARRPRRRSCSTGSGATARCPRPTSSRARAIDWYWRPTNQVRAILEALAEAGILGIARRDGNRRVYDLVERLFPADAPRRAPARATSSAATSSCRATGRTACSGARRARPELWLGTGPDAPRSGDARDRDELVDAGRRSLPVEVEGVRGDPIDARRGGRRCSTRPSARSRRGARPATARRRASRSSPRSTRSSGTATCCGRSSTSTTSGRSTSRPRSGAGATTSCRCCSATGSSVGSSRASIARAGALRVIDVWWEDGLRPARARRPDSSTAFVDALDALVAHARFGGVDGSSGRGRPVIGRSVGRSGPGWGPAGDRDRQRPDGDRSSRRPSCRPCPARGPGTRTCRRASTYAAQRRRRSSSRRLAHAPAVDAPLRPGSSAARTSAPGASCRRRSSGR